MRRTCPHPDCKRTIPNHLYACRDHWFTLPEEIRQAIWRAWRRFTGETYRTGDVEGLLADLEREQAKAVAYWKEAA